MKLWPLTTCLLFILGSCDAAFTDSDLESRALGLSDIPACGVSLECNIRKIATDTLKDQVHDPDCPSEWVQFDRCRLRMP
jgi:hypothetical protein